MKKQKHDFQCIIAASHQASSNTNVCTTGSVCYVCHKKSRFLLDLRLCLDDFRSDFGAQSVLSTLPWRQPDFWWPSIAESSYSNRDFGISSNKESDLERQASKFKRRNWSKLLLCVTAVCAWSKKLKQYVTVCCIYFTFYVLINVLAYILVNLYWYVWRERVYRTADERTFREVICVNIKLKLHSCHSWCQMTLKRQWAKIQHSFFFSQNCWSCRQYNKEHFACNFSLQPLKPL